MRIPWNTVRKWTAGLAVLASAFCLGMLVKNEFGTEPVRNEQFRWHAQVVNTSDICGGFLIDYEWVLTAAHCVLATNLNTEIFTGSKKRDQGYVTIATHVIRHADYPHHWDPAQPQPSGDWPNDFDIALVHLGTAANPEKTSTIQPLDVSQTDVYTDAFISGWICSASFLGKIKRYFSDNNACDGLVYTDLRPLMKLQASGFCHQRDRFICAMGPPDKRPGFDLGDSGGALTTGTIDGAHAIGIAIHVHPEADVYLRLSSYKKWINDCKKDPTVSPNAPAGVTTRYTTCRESAN